MDMGTWLTRWLAHHPLKGLSEEERSRYVAEVMTRVKALQPFPVIRPAMGWGWPRLTVPALATAVGVALVVWFTVRQPAPRVAVTSLPSSSSPQTSEVLPAPPAPVSEQGVRLAAAIPSDEEWIRQTLQLLEQVEEGDETSPLEGSDGEAEWIEELEWLDDQDLRTALPGG